MPATAIAQRRIAHLATQTAIHRAFHWLHLHQPQLRQWQLEMVRIPAPTFQEAARADWFLDRFHLLGLTGVHRDEAGNVLGEIAPESQSSPDPFAPCLLLSAHLDTVFSSTVAIEPMEEQTSGRICAPGICDNAAGLTALLAIAAALRHAGISAPVPILFAANTCEEGEGDLRGMRHLFEGGSHRGKIAAAIALEGSGTSAVVTRALGSLRFRVSIAAPGGHSWSDRGSPNPILILCEALTRVAALDLPADPVIAINIGQITGGTSVNSIPGSATALLDLRSPDSGRLHSVAEQMRQTISEAVLTAARRSSRFAAPSLEVELIGDRPAAALPDDSPLLHTVRAVDRHLNLRTEPRLGSTDANIPLSKAIPAIAIGCGGIGGGIHTLREWYDPAGRETALRRILLTLLDTANLLAPDRGTLDRGTPDRGTPLQSSSILS